MSKFEITEEIQKQMEGNCCLITESEFMKAQKEVVDELPKIPGLACVMYLSMYQTKLHIKLFHKKESEETANDLKE